MVRGGVAEVLFLNADAGLADSVLGECARGCPAAWCKCRFDIVHDQYPPDARASAREAWRCTAVPAQPGDADLECAGHDAVSFRTQPRSQKLHRLLGGTGATVLLELRSARADLAGAALATDHPDTLHVCFQLRLWSGHHRQERV
ncbi:hypothetical protein D3C77_502410 [compost metagenome]